MTFLIPAGLLIIGLLCCIGIAFLVVQARTDERKAVAQKAIVANQQASPLSETIEEQNESQSNSSNGHSESNSNEHSNGHSEHVELQNLQLYSEIEQIAQLLQDDKLSPEWIREQIQELGVKVQDLHQQSSLVERHIALLSQIAMYMNELEQVRHEYKVLREKRGAVLRIPTSLHGEGMDGDTYIHTDKRPAMRKYTLKTM